MSAYDTAEKAKEFIDPDVEPAPLATPPAPKPTRLSWAGLVLGLGLLLAAAAGAALLLGRA